MLTLTPNGLALISRNGQGCCGAQISSLEGFLDDPVGWAKENWVILAAAGVVILILVLARRR